MHGGGGAQPVPWEPFSPTVFLLDNFLFFLKMPAWGGGKKYKSLNPES